MINNFDISKLSKDGYRVLVDDTNVRLPSGDLVYNGTTFRNTFHLRTDIQYDTFVPCGGRPESIDLSSANKLIVDGKSVLSERCHKLESAAVLHDVNMGKKSEEVHGRWVSTGSLELALALDATIEGQDGQRCIEQ